MPSTASGWPYPTSTDTPDVVRDITAVANALEGRAPYKVLHGITAVTPNLAAGTGLTLTGDLIPGGFTQIPDLIANLTTNGYSQLTYYPTLTVATFRIWNPSAAPNANLQVRWTAIQWTP